MSEEDFASPAGHSRGAPRLAKIERERERSDVDAPLRQPTTRKTSMKSSCAPASQCAFVPRLLAGAAHIVTTAELSCVLRMLSTFSASYWFSWTFVPLQMSCDMHCALCRASEKGPVPCINLNGDNLLGSSCQISAQLPHTKPGLGASDARLQRLKLLRLRHGVQGVPGTCSRSRL
jgi:hypothetical protein